MTNPILSMILVLGIVIAAIALVLIIGRPVIDFASDNARFLEAETSMKSIEDNIDQVLAEGRGSSRIFQVTFPGPAFFSRGAVTYELSSKAELFDYLSRSFAGKIARISGNDLRCEESNNLLMENSYIRAEFQRIDRANPLLDIDTSHNLISLTEKTDNTVILPENSSIIIDNDIESYKGNGFTEIIEEGPVCIVHAFVNSTFAYDIYYRLYPGADYLIIEVDNIKENE